MRFRDIVDGRTEGLFDVKAKYPTYKSAIGGIRMIEDSSMPKDSLRIVAADGVSIQYDNVGIGDSYEETRKK